MAAGEPKAWTEARRQRMAQSFPTLDVAEPSSIIETDNWAVAQGQPVTPFSQTAMSLAAYSVQPEPTPDAPDVSPNVEPWVEDYPTAPPFDPYSDEALNTPAMPPSQGYYRPDALAERVGTGYEGAFASLYGGDNRLIQELARPSNYLPIGPGGAAKQAVQGLVGGIAGRFAGDAAYDALEAAPEPLRAAGGFGAALLGGGLAIGAVDQAPRVGSWMAAADQALNPPNLRTIAPEAFERGRGTLDDAGNLRRAAIRPEDATPKQTFIAGDRLSAGGAGGAGGADDVPLTRAEQMQRAREEFATRNNPPVDKSTAGAYEQALHGKNWLRQTLEGDPRYDSGEISAAARQQVASERAAAQAKIDAIRARLTPQEFAAMDRAVRDDVLRKIDAELAYKTSVVESARSEVSASPELSRTRKLALQRESDARQQIAELRKTREFWSTPETPTQLPRFPLSGMSGGADEAIHGDLRRQYGGAAPAQAALPSASLDGARLERQAVRQFGVTNDLRSGGYIMRNGRLLNLAEEGSMGRSLDHRAVNSLPEMEKLAVKDTGASWEYMQAFQESTGAIRYMPEGNGIDITGNTITQQQAATIRRAITSRREQPLLIDFTGAGGTTRASGELRYADQLEAFLAKNDVRISNRREPARLAGSGGDQPAPGALGTPRIPAGADEAVRGAGEAVARQAALQDERTYLKRLFNVDAPEPGLTRVDEIAGAARQMFGGTAEDEIATPIVKMIESATPRIQNQSSRMGTVVESTANSAFKRDGLGRIADLPNRPTIQTVAARYPEFEALLTPPQREAMALIRAEVADYRPLVDEAGIEIGNRRDIMEGGFYLPRGKVVSVRGQKVPTSSGRGGGSGGYRKEAVFDSMEQAIDLGYRYEPLASAVSRHVTQTGTDAVRKYAEALFKEARGETGELLAKTQHERLLAQNPALAAQMDVARGTLSAVKSAAATLDRRFKRIVGSVVSDRPRVRTESTDIIRSEVIDSDAIPAAQALTAGVAKIRGELTLDRFGNPTRSKVNIEKMRQIGELQAMQAIRNRIDAAGGDVYQALDDISEYANRLSNEHVLRGSRSMQDTIQRSTERGRTAGGRMRAGAAENANPMARGGVAREFGITGGEESPHIMAGEVDTLTRFVESAAFDVKVQEIIENPGMDLDDLADALADLRVRANVVGKQGRNFGKTPAELNAAIDEAKQEIDRMRPAYRAAVKRSAQTPMFEGQIDLPGLRTMSFPTEVSAAANRRLDNMKPPSGKLTVAVKAAQATNALFRMTGSTLDISGTALQGLLGAANDPRAYGTALRKSVAGWWDENSLGAYFADFDKRATAAGKPTSKEWAAVGQRINSNLTEYTGEGLPEAIRRAYEGAIPGTERIVQGGLNPMRGANRQFGFFGDILRNELSDTAYDIASGARSQWGQRGVAEPVSREVMADIAKGSNRMTGWSTRRFGGDMGELALFAPRFFQANIETLLAGVQGLRPGASMSQAQARNSLLRLIAVGTALTVAANEARGKETDFRLFINGRRNPNFNRILDVGGQDVSVFGTFDRLVNLVAMTASGEKSRASRSFLNSPIVGRAWDLIAGEDAIGNPVRDNPQQFAAYLLKSVAPFSGQSYVNGAQQAAAGDYGSAAATVGVGATGLRGSPLSTTERVQKGDYGDLDPETQFKGINAEAWRRLIGSRGAPAELREYASYYDWVDAQRAVLEPQAAAEAERKGIGTGEVAAAVERRINADPVAKAYNRAQDAVKDAWVKANPRLALDLYDQYQALDYAGKREHAEWNLSAERRAMAHEALK